MNYVGAQVEDLDKAGAFICGMKWWVEQFDWLTLELNILYLETLDANVE
jgi:hypothetical protein